MGAAARFTSPVALAFDSTGNRLFVAESASTTVVAGGRAALETMRLIIPSTFVL